MEFSDNQPIYKQIIDFCYSRIVSGQWLPDARIPSTKEMATLLAVNNRTILKAYDDMHDLGVIYQRRGLGYFVSADASQIIIDARKREFFARAVPELARQMQMLGLTINDLAQALANFETERK